MVILGASTWQIDLSLFIPVLNYSVLISRILSGLVYVIIGTIKATDNCAK